jgi:hypothetical protein
MYNSGTGKKQKFSIEIKGQKVSNGDKNLCEAVEKVSNELQVVRTYGNSRIRKYDVAFSFTFTIVFI